MNINVNMNMKTTKKAGVLASMVGADGDGQKVVSQKTSSSRQQYRVMDDLTRKRRLRHDLEKLEKDNFHDDPHANLVPNKKAPRFEDLKTSSTSNEDKRRKANVRLRYLSFAQLMDEDSKRPKPNYASAAAPSPDAFRLPKRPFCSVCGFKANYTCVTCGMRFCCISCSSIHRETRCLKWTA